MCAPLHGLHTYNRTIEELKYLVDVGVGVEMGTYNRTIEELK